MTTAYKDWIFKKKKKKKRGKSQYYKWVIVC